MALLQLRARRGATMPDPVHDLAGLTARLQERLVEDESWVAQADGDVVGYVRFTDQWLDDLYVDPTCSRAGIGTLLVDLVKSRIPGGFGLWVFEQNGDARDFYAQQGLIELETTDGSANDERCPDIRMVWPGPEPRHHLRSLLEEVDAQIDELRARRDALLAALERLDGAVDTLD